MAKSVNGGCADEADNETTTPICRCRVLYLGSAVPHITKDGLQGIQEPLRDLYPEQGVFWNTDRDHAATGIDSWLSVWSNGILVENVDDKGNTIRRFHPIESLHYCAAVRFVSVPATSTTNDTKNGAESKVAKFLPLDSPFSKSTAIDPLKAPHPPLFACILRRTSGIKVLECHAFICKKEAAANALVRCCFHAYADTMHAKQIELESPYEQLDKRRSRSIGSALDSQSLIDDKVNNWQKNSTAGSSSGSPDEINGFNETRSITRQKQARTPSVVSLISHSMAEGPVPPMSHGLPPNVDAIYYNHGMPTGTLRSVRSFISLAALKSQKKRSRQIPLPFPVGAGPIPQPGPPPPVMFATLSKKELKKVLKKESTLKRKHKYKDYPLPFLAPNGYPIIYGPPMGPAPAPIHGPIHPIYAPLPGPQGPPAPAFYGTIDSRKGRIPIPQPMPGPMISDNGHLLPPPPPPSSGHFQDEPIYMHTLPSPNGTLHRPVTPHGEPIYLDGRSNGPIPIHMQPGPPPAIFMQQIGANGHMVPCTIVPTLSRKELKELEKQKTLLKKAAKKEKKKAAKQQQNKKGSNPSLNDGQGPMVEEPPIDFYQPRPPYGYPGEELVATGENIDESLLAPSDMQLSSGNYSNVSNSGGGIYKKKGHLNERAFSYSIRQEHRSRSNSLSNLAFENGVAPGQNGQVSSTRSVGCPENGSHNNSSISLKSNEQSMPTANGAKMNGQYEQQAPMGNGQLRTMANGHVTPMDGPIDPNALAMRMSNLSLKNNGYGPNTNGLPPPPPLPPNGYNHHHSGYGQRTATIKRL